MEAEKYILKENELQEITELCNTINLILHNTPIKRISYIAKDKTEHSECFTAIITVERCNMEPFIKKYKLEKKK